MPQPKPKMFYVWEIVIRVALALAAFLLPNNVLTNDVRVYWDRARDLSLHHLPYADFLWEYPPLTVLPLLYLPLVNHSSAGFHFLFVPTMIALEYASLTLVRRAHVSDFNAITAYWSVVVVPASMLVWFRFDYMSIFCATLAMLAIERNKPVVAPLLLGFLAKLWPVFMVVALFARREFKKTALVIAACGAATAAWWLLTPVGFNTFLEYRSGNGFQVESIPGSIIYLTTDRVAEYTYGAFNVSDRGLGWLQHVFSVGTFAGPALIALAASRVKTRNDIALMAGTIAFVLCFNRLISAQFILWLAPFMAYMWPRAKRLGVAYGVTVVLTDVCIALYNPLIRHNRVIDALLVARNVALVYLTVALLYEAFKPRSEFIRPSPAVAD